MAPTKYIGLADAPKLIERAGELSLARGEPVIPVTTRDYDPDPLEPGIYFSRIGVRMEPDTVWDAAKELGLEETADGTFRRPDESRSDKPDQETKETIVAILRCYMAGIPGENAQEIYDRSWDPTAPDRVGHNRSLSLIRRVQLAFGAHIRHTYTIYDDIVGAGWEEARARVKPAVIVKFSEWSGEEVPAELEAAAKGVLTPRRPADPPLPAPPQQGFFRVNYFLVPSGLGFVQTMSLHAVRLHVTQDFAVGKSPPPFLRHGPGWMLRRADVPSFVRPAGVAMPGAPGLGGLKFPILTVTRVCIYNGSNMKMKATELMKAHREQGAIV